MSRMGSGRRSRSARRARPPCTSMCAALCCPFSGGALIPLLRSPSSASDGASGEAAGMEANKRRLTLDLASTLQRWLKVWRSRASACAGAVKPPSTGRPTKGEADTRFSAAPRAGSAARTICRPFPAEGARLQQKGRSEEITTNWSSRLPGTHPLKSVSLRYRSVRLERLPNSAGISPLKAV